MDKKEDFFLRLHQIIGNKKSNPPIQGLIPVSRSVWNAGIKSGIYPQPIKLGPRTHVWRYSDIQNFISKKFKTIKE